MKVTRDTINPSIRKILTDELTDLKGRIAQNILTARSNATGKTIQSMQVRVTESNGAYTGELSGRPFFGALETGSKPWTKQYKHPPKFFRDIIQEWIDAKGLSLNAYLVARKIMNAGTSLYREGGRDTIYSREIPGTIDRINEKTVIFWQNILTETIKLNSK